MNKIITATVAASLAGAMVASAEVSTTFDFASAYVFRGVTFNDEAVFQPGIEATGMGIPEAYGAVAIGAWGNYDIGDYGGALKSSEFSEVDWYGSYSLPGFVEGLDLFVGYTEYTYPNAELVSDKEANIVTKAGYAVIGDLHKIVPAISEEIRRRRGYWRAGTRRRAPWPRPLPRVSGRAPR